MLDIILTGGRILDGTGTPELSTDVGISGDRIVRIGDCSDLDAAARIDCSGLAIAPGFIDMHSHSDEALLADPLADGKIRQGVTTEVGGNCGASPRDMRRFLDALDAAPPAANFCALLGLGTARAAAGGDSDTPLDKAALERARAAVRTACEDGAIGVSSGLIYPPGSFADTAELIALASAAADGGSAFYASHIRSEGDELVESVDEALEVGRRAGVAVQLSHHKAAWKRNWGKVHDSLARVDRALASGIDVALDQYPYKASSTTLDVLLPIDVTAGGAARAADALREPAYAALVAARVEVRYADRWADIVVARVPSERNRHFEGMTIAAIAAQMGRTPVGAALALLAEERLDVDAIFFSMCEDDVRTVLSYGRTAIGTDAVARRADGGAARGKPHPRTFGAFPRVFARYVRDTGLLTLEEAVRRATSLAAARLGLRRRGTIARGWHADLVAFDPGAILDRATYDDPFVYPDGIAHVLVNGVAVVRDGRSTGARGGRVLRRGRDL